MDTLVRDFRFAARSLAKSKLFTVVALLSLALGIGANVTVFSIVNSLALKPLPYPESHRLVDVHEWSATQLCEGCGVGTSFAGFNDWRTSARSFIGMGAYLERPFAVSGTETAERVGGAVVSANVFDILGVHAALGRGFVADDDKIGAAPVVLLSDDLWKRRFAGDRRIAGQTIRVNGRAHTIIGVMPPRFKFPEFAQLWVPITPNAGQSTRAEREYGVVARLKPDVSLESANAEMAAIAKGIEAQYSDTQKEWTARATLLRNSFGAIPGSMYAVLLGAVGFVLLIVCANLAGLLLARGANRQREIAIRLALGGTRGQIIRHLLTESVLLSVAGGALGLLVAVWGVDLGVKSIGSTQVPFYIDFGLDTRTLVFCLGISILTGLLFGLLPALRASSSDVHTTLKESSTAVKRSFVRGMLVIGELALAMVLLAGAGVLMKTVVRISAPESGRNELDLLTANLEFLDAKYQDRNAVRIATNDILERIRRTPGVVDVSVHRTEFIAGFGRQDRSIRAEGVPGTPPASPRFYYVVSPSYFSTVQLPVVGGRGFNEKDRVGAPPVVVINKHLGEALWPGESPLGKRIKLGADSLEWLTVVGIVGDISSRGRIGDYAYVPHDQAPGDRASILLRAQSDPMKFGTALRAAVRAVDPDLPILGLQTIEQQRRETYWPYRMYSITMGVFAVFAVLLAAIGLYGVIAYNTAQRTKEIGVRMALGAEAKHVVGLVAMQGGRLVVIGIVLGGLGATGLLRTMSAMMFGASPVDLPVYAAVGALLAVIAFGAIWMPARRAAAVSPLEALRAE
jgi:putative ABC transport system permease protein